MVIVWLLAGVALVAAELHSQAFYAIFLALGAFGAAIATAFGVDPWVQLAVFAVVSVVGTVILRPPLITRFLKNNVPAVFPGMYGGIVGQQALTLDVVGDAQHPGHAKLAGSRWMAVSEVGPIQPDLEVTVTEVRGTTLVVRTLDGEANADDSTAGPTSSA
jgi:membrane protein implicated in regulation of membrane protease activity